MKSVLLILFVLSFGALSFGQSQSVKADSLFDQEVSVPDSLYKIKKQDFIDLYVTDDTTAALVKMFYRKRKTAKVQLVVIPVTIIVAYVAEATYDDPLGPGKEKVRNDVLTWGGVISAGVALESYMKLRIYTRKELYLALERYKNGGGVLDAHYFQFKESDFGADQALRRTPGYKFVE